MKANLMLGHSAKFSNSLRAIPMIIIRIACIAGFLGIFAAFIFQSYTYFNIYTYEYNGYASVYAWTWVFYIWVTTCLNMMPMVAIAWIALRPPHSDHLHAVVID